MVNPAGPMDEPTQGDQINSLARQLAEAEAALQELTSGQLDAVLDPISGRPILLGEAQAELRQLHDELKVQVFERAAELAHVNRLLVSFIEMMPVGVIIADANGKVLFTNAAGRSILGSAVGDAVESPERTYTMHDSNGNPIPPEKTPLMLAIKEGRSVDEVEILVRRNDGDQRTILASATPILDKAGEIVSGIAVFQDVTAWKETQRDLQRYTDRLQILQSASQAILTAKSVDEIIDAFMPFACEMISCKRVSVLAFEQDADEAIVIGVHSVADTQLGKGAKIPLDEIQSLESPDQGGMRNVVDLSTLDAKTGLAKALQAEGVHSVIHVPLIAQGELLGALDLGFKNPANLTASQHEMIQQMAYQLAIGIRQIHLHERVQGYTEELETIVAQRTTALRTSEARFRTIFEDSVIGIALLDRAGKILACNPALQNILGFREQELFGTTFSGHIHPDEVEEVRELFQKLASGKLVYYQIEQRIIRQDGQVRWIELAVSSVQRPEFEQPGLIIAMVEDNTEKKTNQEALLRTERLAIAGRLGASLAHEINNPLQSVIGCLGLAEEILEDGDEVRRYIEIAMDELERAADIVTQLRDLSRETQAEKVELIDLNTLVEKTLLLTRKRSENRGVQVEWKPAAGLSRVPLVSDRIQQVLLNLVLNAVEAMPDGGRLSIIAAPTNQPDGVQIRFVDNGVGIESDRLPKIFEPFYSTRPEGLGLGLYISKKIVEEHGGSLDASSRIGEGSTFTMWLPA